MRAILVDVGAGLKDRYAQWLTAFPGLIIHAIEPHPHLAETLRNLLLVDEDRLVVHEFAATANDDASCDFYLANDASSSSTLPFVQDNLRKWRYPLGRRLFKTIDIIQVRGRRLDGFLKSESIKTIDFLNIDVQGNAMEVLRGLDHFNMENIKEINVKVHTIDWDLYQGQTINYDVVDFCKRRYFTLFRKASRTRGQEDILCFRNDVAIMKGRASPFGLARRALIVFA